jgi:hypothetical protein
MSSEYIGYMKTCVYKKFLILLLKALKILEYEYSRNLSKQKEKTGFC